MNSRDWLLDAAEIILTAFGLALCILMFAADSSDSRDDSLIVGLLVTIFVLGVICTIVSAIRHVRGEPAILWDLFEQLFWWRW